MLLCLKLLAAIGLTAVAVSTRISIPYSGADPMRGVECQFQMIAFNIVESAAEPDGQWVSEEQAGYSYTEILSGELLPLSEYSPSVEDSQRWYVQQKIVEDGYKLPGAEDAPQTQTIYIRFDEAGLIREVINVFDLEESADGSIATTTRYHSGDYTGLDYGGTGLIEHGFGDCFLSSPAAPAPSDAP